MLRFLKFCQPQLAFYTILTVYYSPTVFRILYSREVHHFGHSLAVWEKILERYCTLNLKFSSVFFFSHFEKYIRSIVLTYCLQNIRPSLKKKKSNRVRFFNFLASENAFWEVLTVQSHCASEKHKGSISWTQYVAYSSFFFHFEEERGKQNNPAWTDSEMFWGFFWNGLINTHQTVRLQCAKTFIEGFWTHDFNVLKVPPVHASGTASPRTPSSFPESLCCFPRHQVPLESGSGLIIEPFIKMIDRFSSSYRRSVSVHFFQR